jgi:hypothetical protein
LEEWRAAFEKLEAENRQQHSNACRVRVHAGKFKAWLEANSLSGSEHTRQRYAQARLDMKRARQAERRAMERMPIALSGNAKTWESSSTGAKSERSFGLFHAVIAGLGLAWLAHHWLG